MNTREREVMDAAAELCRQIVGMLDVPARHRDDANSLRERIDALLAEGSASSEGAEAEMRTFAQRLASAQKPFDPDVAKAIRDNWRKLFDDDTHPQPAQGEHEQRSCEGSELSVLERYGIEWRGPHMPVALPMPDGYWTPWHLAMEALAQYALDAARYRYLRDFPPRARAEKEGNTQPSLNDMWVSAFLNPTPGTIPTMDILEGNALDARIDAAIAAQQRQGSAK